MAKKSKGEKIVLAYSGGLDTSVILPWLKETYGYEVVAFAAELGQGDELQGIKKKALATGAIKCIVKDLRKEFVEEYLWPCDACSEQIAVFINRTCFEHRPEIIFHEFFA